MKREFYLSAFITRGSIGLWGFIRLALKSTSVKTILVIWDALVVNEMREIVFGRKEPEYNIIIMSIF